LTTELDLNTFKVFQRARYLGQSSCRTKVVTRTAKQTDIHNRPSARPGPLKWSVFGN